MNGWDQRCGNCRFMYDRRVGVQAGQWECHFNPPPWSSVDFYDWCRRWKRVDHREEERREKTRVALLDERARS